VGEHAWYPVNLDLRGRRCLVVGGGAVAAEKVDELLLAGADIVVVAPEVGPAITALADAGAVSLARRPYQSADLDDAWYVVAATDQPHINAAVRTEGDARRVFVNAADDPLNCSAMLPARVRRGDLLVTYSTGGASPALSTWLRRQGEQIYGPEYESLVELVASVRQERFGRGDATDPRGWQQALDSGILDLVRQGRIADAKELLEACLSSSSA